MLSIYHMALKGLIKLLNLQNLCLLVTCLAFFYIDFEHLKINNHNY